MKYFFFLLACLWLLSKSAAAIIVTAPLSLNEMLDKSQVVIIAEVKAMTMSKINEYGPQMLEPAATFDFKILKVVKGEFTPNELILTPGVLFGSYYRVAKIGVGDRVLIALESTAKGEVQIVATSRPFIKLISTQSLELVGTDVLDQLINLLLDSLNDKSLLQPNTEVLRDVVSTKIVVGLAPYLQDEDLFVKDNALYAMAVNQQVSAIALITSFVKQMRSREPGQISPSNSGRAIGLYTTPAAVPSLSALLLEPSSGFRYFAMSSLGNIADESRKSRKPFDRSSIPYLILVLQDTEPRRSNAKSAFAILHKLIPSLGSVYKKDFENDRPVETKKLLNWWRDELSGKNPRELMPGETLVVKTIPANIRKLSREQAVAVLNPLLWEMSLETRRAALAQLQKLADKSSIPYLLLACEDPDFDVAYGAYQLLGKLLPEVGAHVIRKAFEADRETALKPLYAWWQDELLDKHSDEGLKRFEQEQQMRSESEKRRATMQSTPTPKTLPTSKTSPTPQKGKTP